MAAPLISLLTIHTYSAELLAATGITSVSISMGGVSSAVGLPDAVNLDLDFGSRNEVWTAINIYATLTPSAGKTFYSIRDTAGNIVVQLRIAASSAIGFYRNVAGVMTLVSTTATAILPAGVGIRFDMKINLSAGTFNLYKNAGSDLVAYAGTLNDGGAITDIRTMRLESTRTGVSVNLGPLWCDTLDTRSAFWDEMTTLAAGTYAEQTSGTEADIDEDDPIFTDKIVLGAVGQRATFTQTGKNSAYSTGYDVQCLVIGAFAKKVTGGRLTAMIRSGTTDQESPERNLDLVGCGVAGTWELNPDGAVAWTYATVDTAQIGFRSKTA